MSHLVDFQKIEWTSALEGARAKVFEKDGRKFRLVEFSRELKEPDWCLKGHIGYILEGTLNIDFNGTVETFGPGDGLYIPPGPKHKHMASVPSGVVRLILIEGF